MYLKGFDIRLLLKVIHWFWQSISDKWKEMSRIIVFFFLEDFVIISIHVIFSCVLKVSRFVSIPTRKYYTFCIAQRGEVTQVTVQSLCIFVCFTLFFSPFASSSAYTTETRIYFIFEKSKTCYHFTIINIKAWWIDNHSPIEDVWESTTYVEHRFKTAVI